MNTMIYTCKPILYEKLFRFKNIEIADLSKNIFNKYHIENIEELLLNSNVFNSRFNSRILIKEDIYLELKDNFICNELILKNNKIIADISFIMNKKSSIKSRNLFMEGKIGFRLNFSTSYSYMIRHGNKNIVSINGLSLWPSDRNMDVGISYVL